MPSYKRDWSDESEDFSLRFARMMWARTVATIGKGIQQVTEEKEPKLFRDAIAPLKQTGEQKEIGWATLWAERLQRLSEIHPDHLKAIHNILEGNREKVSEQHTRDLKDWMYLKPDGSLRPGAEAVLKAAYRETPDGPCIVDPLDTSSPDNAILVQLADEESRKIESEGFRRLQRHLFGKDPKDGTGLGM